ncbi:antigen 5 like allergen Cul n 1 isoform X1 [Drosophila virilis]|uniref:Uncharacterized protein, isoform A n=1 Tax=Drosophila virilis TaxID=7244 RepID=B4LER1_DROVI|nr:antigen 5 like allergen Cul n 1 [Drosophila virilis]EDW70168.1 uncharacterized protein Dvir_GJ13655, isoform A [Drosophila virilis]
MERMCIVVLLIFVCYTKCLAIDFCNMTECKGVSHLGCNNDLTFHSSCMHNCILLNMQIYKDYLVKLHNKYREDVASGALMGLAQASHMPELLWHSKLALIAEYHVKRCLQRLENCMAVTAFPNPAVNYGSSWLNIASLPSYTRSTNSEKLTSQTEQWLHQVYNLAQGDLGVEVYEIKNILNDNNSYVGCAAAEDYDKAADRFVLICYYNHPHEEIRQIYKSGKFEVQQCPHGVSDSYPHLCKTITDIND